jgi:hypothetical protein
MIPSLAAGIPPTRKSLPVIRLPEDIDIHLIQNPGKANIVANCLLNQLARPENVAGLDAHWAFDKYSLRPGKMASVQIAFQNSIYIFHLAKMGIIPRILRELLQTERLKKVGKSIGGDSAKLQRDWSVAINNIQELGELCAKAKYVQSEDCGLELLCESVLNKKLQKPVGIHMSDWDRDLNEDQIKFAALGAWVSLKIFQKATSSLLKESIVDPGRSGLEVMLNPLGSYGDHVQPVARGRIQSTASTTWENHSITNRRCLIEVLEVFAPNALAKYKKDDCRTLGDFGRTPFTLLVDLKALTAAENYRLSQIIAVEEIDDHAFPETSVVRSRVIQVLAKDQKKSQSVSNGAL